MAENKDINLDFFKKAGARGGNKTKEKYGREHFVKIAKSKKHAS